MKRLAVFESRLVIAYDPESGETADSELQEYLASHDPQPSYTRVADEPAPTADGYADDVARAAADGYEWS